MIEKPKKERRFLKTLGKIGEILIQEVLIKIGSNLIKKIGGKKTLPSILFLLASLSLFAQFPNTGNKQRLGFQTSGDGLVFRGRSSDTTTIKPSTINNAYFILDTVNNVLFNYIKTKGGWVFNNTDTVINNITVDTTSLSNRINLKLNIADTASMLAPYFKDADTTSLNLTSRFAAKLNISDTASMLTNYLRSGVAAGTYLTGSGTTNYLPKFTGTLTLASSGLFRDVNRFSINEGTDQSFGWDFMRNTSNPFIGNNVKTSTTFERVERMASTTLFNPAAIIFGYQRVNNSSGATSFGGMNFMTTSGNPSGDINPITFSRMFIEPDGNIGIGTMQPSYKFDIRGTLGVTGATTLSAPLTVNSSAVFNEGSTDSDFRVESDGNANMVFVDASTNRVGIGTNAPTKTLEVNGTFNATGDITEGGLNVLTSADTASLSSRIDGKVSLTATETIGGTKTFNNLVNITNQMTISGSASGGNQLLGKNSSNNGVSDITLGTGLSITSNVLNVSGTDTTSLSNRINLKYDKTGGTISGAVTLSTTSATPTALLGKDGSNVVGTVTTVAQTGLMTRGETTITTGTPSAIFNITHGLGTTPTSVLVTSAGIAGAEKIIFEVYAKDGTIFSVQAWNLNGTEASNKSVKIFWLAIK